MTTILLTSTEYIKSHSGLNDNTYDKMIIPALERSQDIELSEVLGDCLVKSLQEKVNDGTISANANVAYKELLDKYVQPFLCYTTLANITLEIGQVIGNGGINTLSDEHRQTISFEERGQYKDYWKHHADGYRLKMQVFLKQNCSAFPELSGCCPCAELDSAASTSIWLGGLRGKKLW